MENKQGRTYLTDSIGGSRIIMDVYGAGDKKVLLPTVRHGETKQSPLMREYHTFRGEEDIDRQALIVTPLEVLLRGPVASLLSEKEREHFGIEKILRWTGQGRIATCYDPQVDGSVILADPDDWLEDGQTYRILKEVFPEMSKEGRIYVPQTPKQSKEFREIADRLLHN